MAGKGLIAVLALERLDKGNILVLGRLIALSYKHATMRTDADQ